MDNVINYDNQLVVGFKCRYHLVVPSEEILVHSSKAKLAQRMDTAQCSVPEAALRMFLSTPS